MNNITPICLVFIFILSILILSLDKKYTIVIFVIAMCFVPADKSLKIATLDFQALRILAVFAIIKILFSSPHIISPLNLIDKLFISYNTIGAIFFVIASKNTSGAIIYKCGQLVDSIAIYYICRCCITNLNPIHRISACLSLCIIILAPFAFYEYFTANNLFEIFGRSGVSLRDGKVRIACTFSHSILFGSFAAACIPVMWGSFRETKKTKYLIALGLSILYIYGSGSSGPVASLAACLSIMLLFRFKYNSKKIFYICVVISLLIHFVREQPLWHLLFVRLRIRSSSTGYHRYQLIETAINEFKNWWLFGYGDAGPNWHIIWGHDYVNFTDVTNQYLIEGVRGGFVSMLIFIILCFMTIKILGSCAIQEKSIKKQWVWWGWTSMMFTHCVTFLSVSYFGQITMLLSINFAIAAYAYSNIISKKDNLCQNQI